MKISVATSLLALPAVTVLALACSSGGAGSGGLASTEPTSAAPSAASAGAPSDGGGGAPGLPPREILQPVLVDAATKAGVKPADVVVVRATAVRWSDGSLGCPEPGMVYTQALVDGYQIVVRAGDSQLDYRVRGPGSFRICPAG